MGTEQDRQPKLDGVLETVLYARDLRAAGLFYSEILGLSLHSRKDDHFMFFRLADGMLLLFNPDRSRESRGVPRHGTEGKGHVCFSVSEDRLNEWETHLSDKGIEIEQHQNWPRGGRSFYFRDPAGNSLEIATPKIWGLSDNPQERPGFPQESGPD